jgi:protein involved in polysaccharide export with SLBB domain
MKILSAFFLLLLSLTSVQANEALEDLVYQNLSSEKVVEQKAQVAQEARVNESNVASAMPLDVEPVNLIKVSVGDEIRISLPGESLLDKTFSVNRMGRIELPEVGSLFVQGLTEAQLQTLVHQELSKVFRSLEKQRIVFRQPFKKWVV